VTDVFARKIVGFNVASTLKADILPLQALDMAAFTAAGDLTGLTHHSDHGSNYMSLVYTDRIVELGATPSTGTVGDSYDNALAEAINALYKTELIRQRGPWRTVEQVELATLEWVWWWNNQRPHSELGYRTPAEVEATYYAGLETPETATAALEKQYESNPGRIRMARPGEGPACGGRSGLMHAALCGGRRRPIMQFRVAVTVPKARLNCQGWPSVL
jgi:putative transposase